MSKRAKKKDGDSERERERWTMGESDNITVLKHLTDGSGYRAGSGYSKANLFSRLASGCVEVLHCQTETAEHFSVKLSFLVHAVSEHLFSGIIFLFNEINVNQVLLKIKQSHNT